MIKEVDEPGGAGGSPVGLSTLTPPHAGRKKQKQLPRVGEKPALALAWTATGPTLCREKGGKKRVSFQMSETFCPSDLRSWQTRSGTLNIAFIFLCV